MMEHTKEPWELRTTLHGYFNEKCLSLTQVGIGQFELAECIAIIDPIHLVGDLQKANARRIVACVNACAGLNDEQLGSLKKIDDRLIELEQQRDKLLAALEQGARDFISDNGTKPKWWTSNIQLIAEIEATK